MNLCEVLASQESNSLAPQAMEKIHSALLYSSIGFGSGMLLFYLRYGFDMQDRIMTPYLPVLAYMSLKELGNENPTSQDALEESRSTLTLAAKGLSV
ncbi:nitrate assimilation regulatory protein nirA [Fusarium austroafricanum]|uniref:Nitrate assimilation regulatory protein nirA n=1 Tax=Fusarium austroafricanum TaxID=2364996 RepID=A0A8H4KR06_9HYPO|nr:nitrate assimilation regulatory protein nirA [Fusarium austroafricanum]